MQENNKQQLSQGAEPMPERETSISYRENYQNFWNEIKDFVMQFLDIHSQTDKKETIESIKQDIPFRGHTSWILICSIIVASLGLNANSTAVIIGAMLISPLMGPILGMALSLAINDVDLLRRAVKNFGVMVFLSVISAFLFFYIFPLRDTSSELLARTSPDIRDVLIAFFGGLALVIARTKKGTIASVIFGVAIATALMPPLCTVGFFLAISEWKHAMGAMYLFLINTLFIGLATFLVLRLIKLPMVVYANSSKRKKISRIAYVCATLMMIPAGYTFYQVWKESKFKNSAARFIKNNVETYEVAGSRFLKDFSKIEYNGGNNSFIELVFFGENPVPKEVQQLWNNQKDADPYLKNAEIHVLSGNGDQDQSQYVKELYVTNKERLLSSQEEIRMLQQKINLLGTYSKDAMLFQKISKEVAINYPSVQQVSFANELQSNFKKIDTIPTFRIIWKKDVKEKSKEEQVKKLKEWLSERLETNKLVIKQEN